MVIYKTFGKLVFYLKICEIAANIKCMYYALLRPECQRKTSLHFALLSSSFSVPHLNVRKIFK